MLEYKEIKRYNENKAYNSTLDEYMRAVYREMYFLKDEGGRKYKVSNGRFINHANGAYSYSFDLESELYLSDDAPISLSVGESSASGIVMLSDGFQIVVIIERFLGNVISSGYISVEPWKLLQKLNERIQKIGPSDKIALKLIEKGPKLATNEPLSTIAVGQKTAKLRAMTSDITIIWGPPGTGKTHTMACMAQDYIKQGKSVLIVSHSNISVDAVVDKVYKLYASKFDENTVDLLSRGKILRYGYVRDEGLRNNRYVVSFNYALTKNSDLKSQYDLLVKKSEELRAKAGTTNSQAYYSQMLQIEKEIKAIRTKVKDAEKEYVSNARLVATTVSKIYMDSLFDLKKYDVVMFDEASMAYVPQIFCAATFATQHFVCVGDFRQLPPIVQSDAKQLLQYDIFSYLGICDKLNNIHPHPWLVMLNKQRRMHPEISEFSNKKIYKGLLKNHESVETDRADIVALAPFPKRAMNIVDLIGTYCASSKNSDNSRFNILSAIVSFATALESNKSQEEHLKECEIGTGIITPYAAQARLLRAMIQDEFKNEKKQISSATVHQFQGSERNVIVFDAVESYPSSKIGWLMSKDENNSVSRLVNVAITRAKGKFIVVSNNKFWQNKSEESSNPFRLLLKHMEENNNVISRAQKNFDDYIYSLNYGKNITLFREQQLIDKFTKDIMSATSRIIVSLPDANLVDESSDPVLKLLLKQQSNGIELLVKSYEQDNLPSTWKSIAWQSEDAKFPLVVIDDKVIWYGIPETKGNFKEKDTSYRVMCPLAFRITGKTTVEMIKSLTDIDYYSTNELRSKLLPKTPVYTSDPVRYVKKHTSLAEYVNFNCYCYSCNDGMNLAIGKSGKPYLKCPSCKKTDLLTDMVVNRYLNKEKIRCPKYHSYLCAKVSTRLYIRCDNGHFVNTTEI